MSNLKEIATIAIVDIETSSLQQDTEILEIAIWSIPEKVWSNSIRSPNFDFKTPHRINEVISSLFKPRKNISSEASKVNGIWKENVITKPYMSKESLKPITSFIKNLTKPCLFIAHNGFAFDYKHLLRCMKECGVIFDGKECYFGDSLVEFRKTKTKSNGMEKPNYRLENLYKKYVSKEFIQKHTALDDCEKLSILLQNRWDVMTQIIHNAKDFKQMYEITKTESLSKQFGNYNPDHVITASSSEDTEYQFLIRYNKKCRQRNEKQKDEPKSKKKRNLNLTKTPKIRTRNRIYKLRKIKL